MVYSSGSGSSSGSGGTGGGSGSGCRSCHARRILALEAVISFVVLIVPFPNTPSDGFRKRRGLYTLSPVNLLPSYHGGSYCSGLVGSGGVL